MARVKNMPMLLLFGGALFGGLWFLTWHSYARDDDDLQWLDPGQPPAQVLLPLVPAQHGTYSPMSCNGAFRSRCYPDLLCTVRELLDGD